MKSYRLILVFSVFAIAILACAWILGFINQDQAFDLSGRVIGVVLVLGVCGGIVFTLMRNPQASQNDSRSNEPGPKF